MNRAHIRVLERKRRQPKPQGELGVLERTMRLHRAMRLIEGVA